MRAWLDGFWFSSSAETQQLGLRRIVHNFSDLNRLSISSNSCRTRHSVHFVTCPKQGREMEAIVLHRVAFLEYFCPLLRTISLTFHFLWHDFRRMADLDN